MPAKTRKNMEWIRVDKTDAPKDGTKILVCNTKRYHPQVAVWASYHPNAQGKMCFRTDTIGGDKINYFTHWMPLPEKPSEEEYGMSIL